MCLISLALCPPALVAVLGVCILMKSLTHYPWCQLTLTFNISSCSIHSESQDFRGKLTRRLKPAVSRCLNSKISTVNFEAYGDLLRASRRCEKIPASITEV